ncbi:sn-glycerol 3-phosphate transport system permease protein [Clostridium saccharoperbutylacetonicum]|uniref:ABC-type sugar transport system, permease component n=1 Tax=Clostridium saccharoperbutylacetonicum N1-4(HMT) TaxID=931276 RepID=M1MJ83_9CLOT|nr:carbohydrate ABC transporter permease [Clostridium saccharoperbutylacetonicum]AGF57999.1 ABC-type sugar transport system, permease component [Clostridium saccharoperbutylacetonicum N1-4(HMT)]NRT61228.1 sn-glycerol 3-phosphate transport system permease protein [Clostridium saccharoperbutylacetonicum]NSB24545.1 sn-glycerol 3-phosphate transport system permease protein [Clostridium saccharoperbutylacetonicum]NSB43920.1 sn-glycerol 3-phosphate transport system permease protein [Clostridium sacch
MENKARKYVLLILNIIIGIIIIAPILYGFNISLMSSDEIFSYPPKLLPSGINLDNYRQVIETVPILGFIFNSVFVSLMVTIGQIITSCLAAYAFSYFDFKGKNLLFILSLSTLMIPSESTIIANYLTIAKLGWTDSYSGLIVPFLVSAMGIFLIRQFYLTVPKELKEASTIDGCSNLRFFIRVLLPMSKPVIASLGVYTFLNTWNQYMWPLLVTNAPEMRTVQIGISMLQFAESQNIGVVFAGVIMIILPSIVIFIIGQKQLVEGITSGAVKG